MEKKQAVSLFRIDNGFEKPQGEIHSVPRCAFLMVRDSARLAPERARDVDVHPRRFADEFSEQRRGGNRRSVASRVVLVVRNVSLYRRAECGIEWELPQRFTGFLPRGNEPIDVS